MPSRTSRHVSRHQFGHHRVWIGPGLACAAAGAGMLALPAPAAAATPAQAPLLSQGSGGSAVSRLQRALHITPSGRFDAATEHAVIAFQRRGRLSVDGIVGPRTWDTLLGIKPTRTATPGGTSSGTGGYSIPAAIVQCESGGNYSAVNPTSGAGGAYQILPSTWQSFGGQGLPQNAPKAQQDRIAAQIYATQGRSAWSC